MLNIFYLYQSDAILPGSAQTLFVTDRSRSWKVPSDRYTPQDPDSWGENYTAIPDTSPISKSL